jgi:hypothetical protein
MTRGNFDMLSNKKSQCPLLKQSGVLGLCWVVLGCVGRVGFVLGVLGFWGHPFEPTGLGKLFAKHFRVGSIPTVASATQYFVHRIFQFIVFLCFFPNIFKYLKFITYFRKLIKHELLPKT